MRNRWWLGLVLVLVCGTTAFAVPPESPDTIVDGTKVCGASAAVIATLGAGYAIKIRNTSTTESVKYGDSTPALTLEPRERDSFDVSDLTSVYCQRAGSSDVTIEWAVLK